MHSTKLALEGCHNTRDLGGLPADGGRAIRRGRLLRSDFLWKATESDERLLVSLGLRYIADFRNRREHDEAPDRPISGATALHLPVLPERADGITHEQEDPLQRIRRQNGELIEAGIDARESMRGLYRRMLQSDCALTAYRTFMQTLLQSGGATVLWHCSAGKDRAGVGLMLCAAPARGRRWDRKLSGRPYFSGQDSSGFPINGEACCKGRLLPFDTETGGLSAAKWPIGRGTCRGNKD